MLFKTPKTATAVALALGLSAPLPLAAQEVEPGDLPECMEMVTLPCVTATGARVEDQAELDIYLDAFPEEAAAAAERAAAAGAAEVDAAADPEETTEAPEDPAAGTEAPEAEVPEAEVPEAEVTPPEEAPPEAEVEPAPVEPPPEAAPAPEAPEAAEPEAAVPEQPVTEPPAAEAEVPAPDAAEAAPEPPAVPPEPRPEDLAEETPPQTEAQGMAVTDDTAPPAAAAAATTADAAPEGAEVEETVVTEETARSSAEDFATAIEQLVAPAATGEAATTTSRRNETLQRAIVAGLAGAALGTLLDQGNQVAVQSDDRLVLRQDDGALRLYRDENALLRQPGARVRTETFDDGSTRTTVGRDDGTEIVTIRGADGAILRRIRVLPDGRQVLLIDDTVAAQPIEVARLPEPRREALRYTGDEDALRQALARATAQDVGRTFTLRQIREIDRVRYLAPEIELDAVTFATGSAAITPDQARQLSALGRTLVALIDENPGEVFLVEGHTDAVGDASYNLALSDRRAESVALALSEYFDVPPENLVVQGYGEFDLRVATEEAERQNRRAVVRRITGLLGTTEAALR